MEAQQGAAGTGAEKKIKNLPLMIAGVWSDELELQLKATRQFRKLLSTEGSPRIDVVIQSGVVPQFVEFLKMEDHPKLQYQAAWALTNIAEGTSDHVRVVIESGAVPIFVRLLGSPSDDVREQAVWALGNVAGESPKDRDFVLGQGALIPLLQLLNEHAKLSMLRIAAWTLSNFCRGKPRPPFEKIRPALPALKLLIHSKDEEILTHVCWALFYLADGTNDKIQTIVDKIQAIVDANVCPRLVEILMHPSPSVVIPALRTVGSICTGNDLQTRIIINHQLLPFLRNLLTKNHKESIIKKEACWAISNITAGNKDQIQAVIVAEIIGPLLHLLQTAEFDVKKEAAWAISNAISGGTEEQIKYLVGQGCIRPLCDLLVCPDPIVVIVCLRGIESILKVGEAEKNLGNTGINVYARLIDEAEGLEKIKTLKSHANTKINEKAVKIVETYWMKDDFLTYWMEDDDEPFEERELVSDDNEPFEERELVSQLKRPTPEKPCKNLKSHDNTEINEKAVKILETYRMEDDDKPFPSGDAAAAASPSDERELVSQLKRQTPEKPSENTNGMETQAEGESSQSEQPETGGTVGPSGFQFPLLKKLKTWLFNNNQEE